jgi:phage/plasmid-associated DNA primase
VPDRVKAYTEQYRLESDPVREFLEDACMLDPTATTTRSALASGYQRWATMNAQPPLQARQLALPCAETASQTRPSATASEPGKASLSLTRRLTPRSNTTSGELGDARAALAPATQPWRT